MKLNDYSTAGLIDYMTVSDLAERAIVHKAQSGDPQAFGELVLLHQTFVYNLALRALGDSNEAQDLAQEAFLRAWQGLGGFRGASSFRTWLYRIVMNLCYNRSPQLKKSLAQMPVDESVEEWLPAGGADPERELESAEMRSFLHRQIEKLPEGYRLVVMLRYQQDLSYEEIAEVTGMPLGTVKTGLFRAHARLKAALQSAQGSQPRSNPSPVRAGNSGSLAGVLPGALVVGRGGGG